MVITPWQAPFPTPFSIPWFAYTGSDTVTDELGNAVKTWAAPVLKDVHGWDILTSEKLGSHATEERFEAFLETQVDFWPGIQDRIGLPLPTNGNTMPTDMFDPDGSLAEGIFDVVGHDIENASFTQWTPGNIILLKRAEG